MGETLVVIGSNSFSGSHFVTAALEEGLNVVGISRSIEAEAVFLPYKWEQRDIKKFSFFQFDLNHDLDQIMKLIREVEPDYIANFAAQGMVAESWNKPEQWLLTNTLSAVKLHHQLKDCKFLKKFIQVSTPEVYGSCKGNVKESTFYNPSTPYAVSKAAADMSLMTFFNQYNFPVVFTRSANVYGPGQRLYRVIPKAAIFFMTGKKFELHGGGKSIRSFIHIKDVVHGTLKAMRHGRPGNIYHLATNESLSIRSLVRIIAEKIGVSFESQIVDVNDRPGKDNAYYLDSTRAFNEFGWEALTDLGNGIDDTIAWIENNLDVLNGKAIEYIHKP